jgi:hypothetical protein
MSRAAEPGTFYIKETPGEPGVVIETKTNDSSFS